MLQWLLELFDRRGDVPSHDAPAPLAPTTAPLAPTTTPAVRQEQFADVQAQHQQERVHTLYQRVMASNNRNVTRDYGKGPVELFAPDARCGVADADEATFKELEELGYGLMVTDGERKKMVEKDRRRYDAAPLGHALLWTKD